MSPLTINGDTELIAHIGYPTHTFKSPLIYNPYFAHAGINAVVVPMGCKPQAFASLLRSVFDLTNIRGALITMPHKMSTVPLLHEASPAVRVAQSCNAVKRDAQGRLVGDMFDGQGFVRGVQRKGLNLSGKSAWVIGSGGVGSAIAAALAQAGVKRLKLSDLNAPAAQALAQRLKAHYPAVALELDANDPSDCDLVVNATPLGMNDGDPLPLDVTRLSPNALVGDVVMKSEMTAFLRAAQARGCTVQVGSDMLFEQIPAYLEFFGLPSTSAQVLRQTSALVY